MQYDVKTPEEYIEALEDDWRREKLEHLRTLIKSKAPDFVEGIEYKMLNYSDDRGTIFYLNAQKNYVSLYTGDAKKIDPDGSLLKGIDVGKGLTYPLPPTLFLQNQKFPPPPHSNPHPNSHYTSLNSLINSEAVRM